MQPFGNYAGAMTLTGADLDDVLEQQYQQDPDGATGPNDAGPRGTRLTFGTNEGFVWSYDLTKAYGDRVPDDSIKLNGVTIVPTDDLPRRGELVPGGRPGRLHHLPERHGLHHRPGRRGRPRGLHHGALADQPRRWPTTARRSADPNGSSRRRATSVAAVASRTSTDPRPVPIPWGPASGVGSLPGTDAAEAVRLVVGELPDFAHLPELPGRGAGADLIGRSAALLVDLAFDLTPAGWRLVPRPGVDQRRAKEFLDRDLDALYDVAGGYTGPFKVQAAGPWTLAAGPRAHPRRPGGGGRRRPPRPGAVPRRGHRGPRGGRRVPAARRQRRRPARRAVACPPVLQGGLPTVSGFGKLSAVEATVVEQELADLVRRLDVPVVVHCCAPRAPLDLFRAAGAAGLSFDLGLVQDLDAVGTAIEAGTHLFPGVVPGTDAILQPPKATASRVQAWWRELGFDADRLADAVTLTPVVRPGRGDAGLRAIGDGARARGREVPAAGVSGATRVRAALVPRDRHLASLPCTRPLSTVSRSSEPRVRRPSRPGSCSASAGGTSRSRAVGSPISSSTSPCVRWAGRPSTATPLST